MSFVRIVTLARRSLMNILGHAMQSSLILVAVCDEVERILETLFECKQSQPSCLEKFVSPQRGRKFEDVE